MGYGRAKRVLWLLVVGIGSGCGDGLVDVDPTEGTDTTSGTSDGPTTDPTDTTPTSSTTMSTTDVTTDPTDTTPTSEVTTDPSDTDPTDPTDTDPTDPTTSETSDSDTDPTTSTESTGSDAETTVGVSDTDETDSDSDSDSDSESESDTDPSMGFIIDPDAGGVSLECSIWDQDCPEGEKCMPWANDGGNAWNATRCSPLDPNPAQIGDACVVEGSGVSGIDDCDIATMCWNVDPETNIGYCAGMCMGSENNPVCEDPQASCAILFEGVLALCLANCDPLIQDCEGDQLCIPIVDSFVCAPDASGVGGQQNDPCEYLNSCDPGLLCVNAELVPDCNDDVGCCTSYCNLEDGGADASCVAAAGNGAACVPFFEEGQAPPGLESVGVCVQPN